MSKKETYEIELPQFKGPFDLLLFFIKRDELDIYNIPIHQIAEDFLDYIQKMKEIKFPKTAILTSKSWTQKE